MTAEPIKIQKYVPPTVVPGEVVRPPSAAVAVPVVRPAEKVTQRRPGERSGVILAVPVLVIGVGFLVDAVGPVGLIAAPIAWGLVVQLACWGADGQ